MLLGGLAIVTLFTLKATFLLLVALAVGWRLWEVSRAFAERDITVSAHPGRAGGAAMVALAYWSGVQATLAALVISVIVLLGWRLPGGAHRLRQGRHGRRVRAGLPAAAWPPSWP